MPKRSFLKKYRWPILTLVFISVVAGALYFYGKALVKELVQRYIERETAGAYVLSYEELEYNLIDASFSLSDISLVPSSTNENPIQYSIKLKKMRVNLADLVALYTEKALHIQGVDVTEPVVELARKNKEKSAFTTDIGDLYLVISDYLKVLEIDYINLQSGTFIYANTKEVFDNINFRLASIKIDSLSARQKVFYSEEIDLRLEKESFTLPDSTHRVTFDSFHLSTADSVLEFSEMVIEPIIGSDSLSYEFRAKIPKVKLRGIDFVKAYQNRILELDSLIVDNPIMSLQQQQVFNGKQNNLQSSLFSNQKINHLLVRKGQLTYDDEKVRLNSFLELHVADLAFDSLDNTEWFKGVSFQLKKLNGTLLDSSAMVKIDTLSASSLSQVIAINGINYKNVESSQISEVQIAKILLTSADPSEILKTRKVDVTNLEITKPEVKLRPLSAKVTNNFSKQKIDLSIISEMKIDTIRLADGLVSGVDWSLNALALEANNIKIDSTTLSRSRLNELGNIKTAAAKINFFNSDYRIESNARYVDSLRLISLTSFELNHLKKGNINGDIDVYGVSLSELDSQKITELDSVFLFNPTINWTISTSEGDKLPSLTLGKIRVSNGTVAIKTGENQINLDSVFTVFDHRNENAHQLHELQFKNCTLNGSRIVNSLIYDKKTNSFNLKAISYATDSIDIDVKTATISNWKQEAFWQDSTWQADRLQLEELNIDINGINNDKSTRGWPKVLFNKIAAEKSHLSYRNALDLDFNIELINFDSEEDLFSDSRIAKSENVKLLANNIKFNEFELSELSYNSEADLLSGKELQFDIDTAAQFIAAFSIAGLDVNQLANRNRFIASRITFEKGEFDLLLNNDRNKQITLPWSDLEIGQLAINETDYQIKPSFLDTKLLLTNTNLELKGIYADSTVDFNYLVEKLNASKFSGEKFSLPIADSVYQLSVAKYDYDSERKSIVFKDIELDPLVDRLEYSDLLEFQKDWFDVKTDSIVISGLDLHTAILSDQWLASTVQIGGLEAEVFRDKQMPFDSTQRRGLPQKLFKSLKTVIGVDTIYVKGNIRYAERPGSTDEIAFIDFGNLNGRLINMATRERIYQLPMYLRASGRLMNAADFKANVTFDMDAADNSFRFLGDVGPMDLTSMNYLLEPIANIRIKSGASEGANFVFDGNNDLASGTMDLRYKKLKISFLSEEAGQKRGFTQNLKTFFANSFVIRKSNPRLLNFREGVIFFRRDKKRAIFNFWGKSILSGAVSSVGINRSKRNLSQFLRENKSDDEEDKER